MLESTRMISTLISTFTLMFVPEFPLIISFDPEPFEPMSFEGILYGPILPDPMLSDPLPSDLLSFMPAANTPARKGRRSNRRVMSTAVHASEIIRC